MRQFALTIGCITAVCLTGCSQSSNQNKTPSNQNTIQAWAEKLTEAQESLSKAFDDLDVTKEKSLSQLRLTINQTVKAAIGSNKQAGTLTLMLKAARENISKDKALIIILNGIDRLVSLEFTKNSTSGDQTLLLSAYIGLYLKVSNSVRPQILITLLKFPPKYLNKIQVNALEAFVKSVSSSLNESIVSAPQKGNWSLKVTLLNFLIKLKNSQFYSNSDEFKDSETKFLNSINVKATTDINTDDPFVMFDHDDTAISDISQQYADLLKTL